MILNFFVTQRYWQKYQPLRLIAVRTSGYTDEHSNTLK